ncbi:MAG: nucleoside phosphorylase [Algoriphagus sp.]|jgi:uridine phosphorylase|uniref:nucleoside phosphorylase n=2 Tax=Algoriphagus sp. TaxID=1872435 RepID=UPI002764B838|nr:nucleoside phosphorylase [Algoriphagus sp.]MDP4903666.1 nucleoside phosphorylase [Algoriphagus sp.]MDP5124686.1 nucleoside phosphorylase [Algoriphagus sp.]
MESRQIPETELILHPDGSVYHLCLKPEHLGRTIFTVGDPDRVATVSQHLDQLDFQLQNREFITHTGWKNGHRVSVISTGMGTDNVEILMTELDALVNVDLQTRQVKEKKTSLPIIRIGTSGSLQTDISVGTLLASEIAIGMDSLMAYYPALSGTQDFAEAIQQELGLSFRPYQASASPKLLAKLDSAVTRGVTLTCPGFYAPQGREVRLKPRFDQLIERLAALQIKGRSLTNFEMETAGYYALGELLGHEVLSLNAILANRPLKKFDSAGEATVSKAIQLALTTFCP